MVAQPHILIVGAGLIGLSTADALMDKGAAVTLVDILPGPAQGTSFANSAMIHPSQSRPWGFKGDVNEVNAAFKATHDLAVRSKNLLQEKLLAWNLWQKSDVSGCYKIYSDMDAALAAQKNYSDDGIAANVVMHDLATLGHAALYFEADIWSNAYEYALRLSESLAERGAVFIYEAADLRLRRQDSGVTAKFKDHIFKADHVIICAGPQSPELLAQLDISLPLKRLRGFSVNFPRPDMDLPPAPLMDAQSHSALTIFKDHLRLSGTIDEEDAKPLLRRWAVLAPAIFGALQPATHLWTGQRPMSEAGRPYISSTSIKGLWVNSGHGHMGWTLSAGSGQLMADMILGGVQDSRYGFAG